VINKSAPAKVAAIPKRLVNRGVSIETTPKAKRGKAVSKPSMELDKPVLSLMVLTNGPTLANAGRRLTAINKMPAMSKACFGFEPTFEAFESVSNIIGTIDNELLLL
jgi:hypothetical protein